MDFNLKAPCGNCPFKKDTLKGWLGFDRAEEIAEGLDQGTFACHKTTDLDDEGNCHSKNSKHCAGALIMLEKEEKPSQMMRIAERLGLYNRKDLKMNSNVFDDREDFIDHHSN